MCLQIHPMGLGLAFPPGLVRSLVERRKLFQEVFCPQRNFCGESTGEQPESLLLLSYSVVPGLLSCRGTDSPPLGEFWLLLQQWLPRAGKWGWKELAFLPSQHDLCWYPDRNKHLLRDSDSLPVFCSLISFLTEGKMVYYICN